ncbi:hypothetical protein SISSUDRAFT_294321 [Sistotremastrum suecicum HHB10207 ss-3]|uniref:Carbohydrate-binding module family 19 domain-containing protein n=1 Tax=Sistotremastrum suecicum HHB10207 ss-3 TaxID=1314776 RepID=A0A165ZIF7_9AGAM|nr:hypothetical protein SISSUDRAFT_294321 [Sistotremastrum suecicum HHB10207 ss-3]
MIPHVVLLTLALVAFVASVPLPEPNPRGTYNYKIYASSSSGFLLSNGQSAQALNKKFAALSATDSCNSGDEGCVGGGFAQCVGGQWQVTQCPGTLSCFALPLVNSQGTCYLRLSG